MIARLALVFPILLACGCASQGVQTNALRQVGAIEMPGVGGRIDHLDVDLKGKRLFVAALGNNTVEVIDLEAGRDVHTIEGLREPQGVVYLPGRSRLVVTNGDGASAAIYDADTYRLLQTVPLRSDPDNVRFDSTGGHIFVGEGTGRNGALAVLSAGEDTALVEIGVGGHPESFQLEASGSRIFVNVPSTRRVVVVDRDRGKTIAEWPLARAGANYPMALDEPDHRLFVGTRLPARLLILDTETGKIIAALATAGDADDIFYDGPAQRIYITGGGGVVAVVEQVDADTYRSLGQVQTAPGARTALFVPEWRRLYVAVPQRGGRSAAIRIYSTEPSP
ncbi:MAG TPA: hypothetical protein VFG50_06655 [Rhodothermales bacterium]|nr:hypothetical protein [Rhodothermales bacterium]